MGNGRVEDDPRAGRRVGIAPRKPSDNLGFIAGGAVDAIVS
jgi:hypothetical protein